MTNFNLLNLKKSVFTILFACLFILQVNGQSKPRYIKEIKVNSTEIQYEMYNPDFIKASVNYTNSQLNSRFAKISGFVSILRSTSNSDIFFLTLDKLKAESIIKNGMFYFKDAEIIRLNNNQIHN